MPGLQNFLAFSCQYHSLPSHWNKDWGTTFHLHHQWCFSDDATWDHGGTRDFPGKLLQCWSFFLPFPPLPIIMFLGSLLTSDCMLGNENIPFSLANCIGDKKTKVYSLLELCIKQEQIGPKGAAEGLTNTVHEMLTCGSGGMHFHGSENVYLLIRRVPIISRIHWIKGWQVPLPASCCFWRSQHLAGSCLCSTGQATPQDTECFAPEEILGYRKVCDLSWKQERRKVVVLQMTLRGVRISFLKKKTYRYYTRQKSTCTLGCGTVGPGSKGHTQFRFINLLD